MPTFHPKPRRKRGFLIGAAHEIPVAIAVLLAGCAVAPHQSDLTALHGRFFYVPDTGDAWCKAPKVGRFAGDCEDFAFSMQAQLGGVVWHVVLHDGRHHAVLLLDGWVYDNLHGRPVRRAVYPAKAWLVVMTPPAAICPAPAWFSI